MEHPLDALLQRRDGDFLRFDRDRARFDLGQIENVVDQRLQVGPGRVNVLREFDLLRREIPAGIVTELLAENENRIERRPQLVRHVRQKLGFVFRRQRQFRRLLFECAARLLDLVVLPLDLDVLFRQLLRLGRQLLVRALQLGLPRLQLEGELLRLLQQILGPHRRFDRVQDDADRLGQLLEERQVGLGERLERRELDDRLGLPFEQHRQDDDVLRPRAAEARVHVRVAGRHFRQQNTLPLERALPDQPLADVDAPGLMVADGITGEQ